MTIGERFKAIRLEQKTTNGKKLTQEAFAKTIGMTRDTLANVENDRNPPTEAVMQLICDRYGVNIHWLKTGEGDMYIQLQRVDEISDFFKRVLNADVSDEGEASLQAFITALARLSPEQLTSAAKLIDTFIENYTDAKKEGQE